jgi:DNA-binding MarR family transcriptional regulator
MTEQFINRSISILYRYNQRFFAQKLQEYSLPIEVGQIPTLIQVYRHPGITQDGISSNACMDKGTVARTIKQLEENNIIIKESDPKDRRVNHIFATQKGMKCKEQLFLIIRELHGVLYQGFSDSDIAEAISMLQRMRKNMLDYLKE